jgi:hypothetical protein
MLEEERGPGPASLEMSLFEVLVTRDPDLQYRQMVR